MLKATANKNSSIVAQQQVLCGHAIATSRTATHGASPNNRLRSNPQTEALPTGNFQTGAFQSGGSLSRDEMNLAEFPLAILSTRNDANIKTLEFADQTRLPGGEFAERKWIITGADKFGLPTSTDDDVVLGLIRLTMDQGFRDRKVYFTRYELLKTLRWSTEGRSYKRLIKSLDRLSGVRIRSSNSFYDNKTKSYQTCNFGIIDAYEVNSERIAKSSHKQVATGGDAPKSFFIWSEALFNSFKAGFIKKLDLDIYFSLKSAISRRLYRYLDKHFYYRSTLELPLLHFAFEKLGLSRSYKYVSSVKQQLSPALNELVAVGFLSAYEFGGNGQETTVRFFAKKGAPGISGSANGAKLRHAESDLGEQEEQLAAELVRRGLAVRQAAKLMSGKSADECAKIKDILDYYDYLVQRQDRLVSRNALGFLYRAVEMPFRFTLPEEFRRATAGANANTGVSNGLASRGARSKRPELRVFSSRAVGSDKDVLASPAKEAELREKAAYKAYYESQLNIALEQMEPLSLSRLTEQVQAKMACLKSVLNETRFEEAVQGCVKDELAKMAKIPDYHAWRGKRLHN